MRTHFFCRAVPLFAAAALAGALGHAQTPGPATAAQGAPNAPPNTTPNTAADAGALTLAQVLRAARENAEVQIARAALAAARGDVIAADRAPNPVLTLKSSQMDLQNGLGSGNLITRKRIDKSVGVDWTWERGDKRALRTRSAQRSAAAAQADLDDTEVQQLLAAASAWVDLAAAQDRLQQVQAIERSASQLADTAQRRLKAGDLSQQDTTRAEIEARRAAADTLNARLDLQRAALALAALIGPSAGAPAPAAATPAGQFSADALRASGTWRAGLDAAQATAASPAPADATLEALLAQRADIRAAQERVDASRAALDAAQALRRADVTWGVSLDNYPGTSTRLLELRMQLPIQSPALGGYDFQGEIARAAATLQQAQGALDRLRLQARADILRLQQERQASAQRVLQIEQDILPRARRVADNAELAYTKGALSLTDLLDARRTLRATLLDAVSAHAEHTRADTAWTLRTQPDALLAR